MLGKGGNPHLQRAISYSDLADKVVNPKHYHRQQLRLGAYTGQLIGGLMAQIGVTVGLWTYPAVIFLTLECRSESTYCFLTSK